MTSNERRDQGSDLPDVRPPTSERTGPPLRPLPANIAALPSADRREKLRVLEALLFAASEPLDVQHLASHLAEGDDVNALLTELQGFYASRGINLVRVAGKWAFRTADDLSFLLERHAKEERRLSKAALETLAIIAYHQPVTRAEIEEIRGVQTSKGTLDVLLETGWVRPRGRRRAPGKPITYGTTETFLSHFNLDTVKDLPGLAEIFARYGFTSAEYEAVLRANYESLATLVPRARFFVASESGHNIHQDQPELVIEAIRQVVAGVRNPDTWSDLTACCVE